MQYLWVVIGLLFALNLALTVYFFNKFEKMFIIMKAWSLTDLMKYYKDMNKINEPETLEDDDLMP